MDEYHLGWHQHNVSGIYLLHWRDLKAKIRWLYSKRTSVILIGSHSFIDLIFFSFLVTSCLSLFLYRSFFCCWCIKRNTGGISLSMKFPEKNAGENKCVEADRLKGKEGVILLIPIPSHLFRQTYACVTHCVCQFFLSFFSSHLAHIFSFVLLSLDVHLHLLLMSNVTSQDKRYKTDKNDWNETEETLREKEGKKSLTEVWQATHFIWFEWAFTLITGEESNTVTIEMKAEANSTQDHH